MAKKKKLITNGYVQVCSDEDLEKANFSEYRYEHIIVAEEQILDRSLKEGEEVHHLDKNRANNSPDNLLVLSGPMHAKLHSWLNKNIIIPKPEYQERINRGCVRCPVCDKPIDPSLKYCSHEHANFITNASNKPDKHILEQLISEMPMTKIGEKYNVSGVTVKNWCKKDGIELENRRGYWQKKASIEKQ